MNRHSDPDWRDASVRRNQAMRDLDMYAWAPRRRVSDAALLWAWGALLAAIAFLTWAAW